MNAARHLHALIHALEKEEKRFFRLFLQKGAGKVPENSAALFDVLHSMEKFDADFYRFQMDLLPGIGNLAVAQTRLLDLILKSQVQLKAGRSAKHRFRELMVEIEFLFEKGQIKLCEKRIAKARKLARTFELETGLLDLMGLEAEIRLNAPQMGSRTGGAESGEAVLSRLELRTKLYRYQQQLRHLIRTHAFRRQTASSTQFEALMQQDILQDPPEEDSFFIQIYYHNIHALYQLNTGHFDPAKARYEKLLARWEAAPAQIGEHPRLYLSIFNNYLVALFNSADPTGFPAEVERLQQQPRIPRKYHLRQMQIAYSHGLNFHLYFGDKNSGHSFMNRLNIWLGRNEGVLNIARLITFWYNISVYYFLHGQSGLANRWLLRILQLSRGGERKDIRTFARLFQVVLNYELENEDLVARLCQSCLRTLRRDPEPAPFHLLLVKFFQQLLLTVRGTKPWRERLESFLGELADLGSREVRRQETGLDLCRMWVEARLSGQSLHLTFQEGSRTPD